MKYIREFVVRTFVGGVFVAVPAYLAFLLLLKGMESAAGLMTPVAALMPSLLPTWASRSYSSTVEIFQ